MFPLGQGLAGVVIPARSGPSGSQGVAAELPCYTACVRGFLRRRWLIAIGVASGLFVLGALALVALYPRLAAWAIRERVFPRLESRLDRSVSAGRVDATRGTAVLEDIAIAGSQDAGDTALAHMDRVVIEFDFWASLTGTARVHRVTVEGARIHAVRHADGSDNIGDLLERLGPRTQEEQHSARLASVHSMPGLRPDVLVVTGAEFAAHDLATGLVSTATDIDVSLPRQGEIEASLGALEVRTGFGPSARAARIRITADVENPISSARVDVQEGEVSLHRAVSLSNIAGSIYSTDAPGRLRIDLKGSYSGASQELWQAEGWVEPLAGNASVHLGAERFTFDRLDSILRGSAVVDYQDTAIGADVDIDVAAGRTILDGTFELTDVNVYHPLLAAEPVQDIDIKGQIQASFDSATQVLTLDHGEFVVRGVTYQVDGSVSLPGGIEPDSGQRRSDPRVAVHVVIPPIPCQDMLEGLPEAMRPYLDGFELSGRFDTDVTIEIDWRDLDATELSGRVGLFACEVKREPEGEYGLERLLVSFTHTVEVERDQWIEFVIGPENPDFVHLWDVSPHLLNSLMTTEDSRFYDHNGFIIREFRTALIKNLKANYFRYGASSITMQTVKNVLLHREKTLARKLQELFLTWYIETKLDKDRIFEIYINAIEYGPGIYGIGPAARHYFGKHPRDLNPVEAAFFSSILPSPKRRYKQYCEGKLWRWTENKIQRVLALMHKRERLTDAEYEAAVDTPLVFDRTEAPPVRECKRMVKRAIENDRPTNPMEE